MPNRPPTRKRAKGGSMKSFRTAAVALAVLSAGCGGVTLQQFDPKGEPIKTIALISVPNPDQYEAVDYGSPAGMFGAIGGAAIAAEAKTMSETLTKAAREANFDYSREMQAAVTERLKRAGYKVVVVRAERGTPKELVGDYAKVPRTPMRCSTSTRAWWAILATNINDPEFRPYLLAEVRLVSAKTRTVLYSEQLMFGYHNPLMSATQLPSDKKYYFKDFTALMADKPRAFEGWRQGTQAISDHIAQRLTAK